MRIPNLPSGVLTSYIGRCGWWVKSDMWVPRVVIVFAGIAIAGCASMPPANPADVCDVFVEKRSWYRDAQRASQRWQVPVSVLMAFTYQESSFRARARPPRRKLLGFIPWTRTADAYGFAQATDAAWSDYTRDTRRRGASRDKFADAIDFVGWYNDRSNRRNQIPKTDAYRLYLAYHEGHGGYARQTYADKAWLLDTARNVASRAGTYDSQLQGCEQRLQRRWWRLF